MRFVQSEELFSLLSNKLLCNRKVLWILTFRYGTMQPDKEPLFLSELHLTKPQNINELFKTSLSFHTPVHDLPLWNTTEEKLRTNIIKYSKYDVSLL